MKPILFVHGYSAENDETTKSAIRGIYGSLPQAVRRHYGRDNVEEIDLSRWASLEDAVNLDDVARALDRALHAEHPHLLKGGFHAITHSTGALVVRNWLRRFSARPSPLNNLAHLAGANFGSGWAHIGQGQFAKWGRMVFDQTDRGIRILEALEFGADWTIDLHLHFLQPEHRLDEQYGVREHVIVGTQADVGWFSAPIRYAKEDGSDGVVRCAAANLNFNHVILAPKPEARTLTWKQVAREQEKNLDRSTRRGSFYEFRAPSRPGVAGRPVIPFAIPHQCAHSGEDMGIVRGSKPRRQVMCLIDLALRSTKANWANRVEAFEKETERTYDQAARQAVPPWWKKWIDKPSAQYDKHAQVILRLRDQDGRPVPHYDVFFDSVKNRQDKSLPIREPIEHQHVNGESPNVLCFYLRTDVMQLAKDGTYKWDRRVPKLGGCYLEVTAIEPATGPVLDDRDRSRGQVAYLPVRKEFTAEQLEQFLQPHQTTVIDVEMLRVPSGNVYKIVRD